METSTRVRTTFSVIGKEGSTESGVDVVERLWKAANADFHRIKPLAKTAKDGTLAGVWGLMSDFSREFQPWTKGFSEGLYLAGVEVEDDAIAPEGWTKWTVPAFEFVRVKVEGDAGEHFREGLRYLGKRDLALAGSVQDNLEVSENGQKYIYFPVKRP